MKLHSWVTNSNMKKYLPIYLYGSLIILAGVFVLFSNNYSFDSIKITVGISLIIGAVFAFVTSFVRQRQHVQFAYHEMHALVMLAYGIGLLFFCNSLEKLITFTSFIFLFYAFSEILFCNWLFNLSQKVVFKIVLIRALLGLIVGIGTAVAMNYTEFTLPLFGVFFILVGLNIILYVPVMKGNQPIEISKIM
jgi:uncharacterized membrane protein HdeD (DUF308 family)